MTRRKELFLPGFEYFADSRESLENGRNTIFSKYVWLDIRKIGQPEGLEGHIYIVSGLLKEELGQPYDPSEEPKEITCIVKTFDGLLSRVQKFTKKDKEEQCLFTSRTADLFRREGLPVLPLVKSVLKQGEMSFVSSREPVSYPCVFMTQLGKTRLGDRVYTLLNDKLRHKWSKRHEELYGLEDEIEGMFRDLAKIHKLGFVMKRLPDSPRFTEKKHPPHTLWLLNATADGNIRRYLVDLTNLAAGESDTDREDDLKKLLEYFQWFRATTEHPTDLQDIYLEEMKH